MNEKYMKIAIDEAHKAYKEGEVPVGAIIIKNDKIISKAHNLVEKKHCSIMHAEILAIKKATKKIRNWRLNGCEMYVTLEPCTMCAAAIANSRIDKVYFSSKRDISEMEHLNCIHLNTFSSETTKLLKDFFKSRRSD